MAEKRTIPQVNSETLGLGDQNAKKEADRKLYGPACNAAFMQMIFGGDAHQSTAHSKDKHDTMPPTKKVLPTEKSTKM